MWMVEAKYGILASHLSISDLTLDIQQYLTNLFNLPPDKNSCCTKIASFSHQVLSVRLLSMFVPVLAWFCFPFENSPNPFGHVMQTSKNEFTLLVKSPEIHFYCTPVDTLICWHGILWSAICMTHVVSQGTDEVTMLSTLKTTMLESHTFYLTKDKNRTELQAASPQDEQSMSNRI